MVWTAVIMGFAGSFHCLGMCSPLAAAVVRSSSQMKINYTLYNLGRVFTYGLLGSIVASVGMLLPMSRYQNLLSIVLGIVLFIVAVAGVSTFRVPYISAALRQLNLLLKRLFTTFIQRKGRFSTFVLGMLNGFLPCGLSFLALTFCVTLAGPMEGFYFMVLFGLGTLPAMVGVASVVQWLVLRLRLNSQKVTTALMMISAIVLIARVFIVHLPQAPSFQEGVVDIVLCR